MLLSRMLVLVILGVLLTVSACESPVAVSLTATPTITPTTEPPQCSASASTTYVTSIPNTSFTATNVYAVIPLPPQTRFQGSDALGGVRFKIFCSGGTVASIQAFMTLHLTQLGWQPGDRSTPGCLWEGDAYHQSQCWKNGAYALFLGINSPPDWLILFHDPDYPA